MVKQTEQTVGGHAYTTTTVRLPADSFVQTKEIAYQRRISWNALMNELIASLLAAHHGETQK